MTIDMQQFYQIFFEEAHENLTSMESLLLEINVDTPSLDKLNAIFRAAHSIKGASSTFGFSDMAAVTHSMETLLDGLRKNEFALTSAMLEAFIQASDVLKSLLDAHQNETEADLVASESIRSRLEQLAGKQSAANISQPSPPLPNRTVAETIQYNHNTTSRTYQIKFANSAEIFGGEEALKNLLEELGSVGRIVNQTIVADSVSLTLTSDTPEAELREIFDFFLRPDQLTMKLVDQQKIPAESSHISEEEQGYGFFDPPEAASEVNLQSVVSAVEVKKTSPLPVPPVPPVEKPAHETIKNQPEINRNQTIATAAESSIRVSVAKVDQMINLVGELVITKSILSEIVSNLDPVMHESLVRGLAQLELNTRELQEAVMSVRMMPINFVFSRFPRLVRDLSMKLEKKAQLKLVGESTELDKGLIEKISDPLIHLVRNCMDHGIETPEQRIASGKDPQGTITLSAAHQGGNIIIQISDDGSGLNRKGILAKAREKGLSFNEDISDSEVWQMIYAPGFSTAVAVSDVSGRGVGMDVVKRDIESIGGRVEISSIEGAGSTFTIRLPLTLAILDGLSIAVGEQFYIVPLSFIIESLQPQPGDVKEISGHGRVLHVRGEYLPVIALHEVFGLQPRTVSPEEGILVILETEGRKVALWVDNLLGQHQVVIKSLESNFRKISGISGATIMGDGSVALILDVGELVKLAQK